MKRITIVFLLMCMSLSAMASDTSVLNAEGVEIWYDFDSSAKKASVTYKGDSYFSYSSEYSGEVVIPSTVTYEGVVYSVTSIGDYAFSSCYNLTSITLPEGVTSIGERAFYSCYKLYEVYNKSDLTITAGSEDNGYVAYYAKNVYTDSEGESKLKTVGDYLFYADGEDIELIAYTGSETSITLPSDYEGKSYNIGDYAFYNCSSLTSITLPDGLTSIGYYAFYGCSSLTSITLPDGLTSINLGTFQGCSSLTSITLPDGLTSMGHSAFEDCSSLTSITLPESVTWIGDDAFDNCYKLYEVYNKSNLTITAGSTDKGYVAYYAKNVYTDSEGESKLRTVGDYLFYADGEDIELIAYTGSETSITLPSDYEGKSYNIGNYAFQGCSSLTSITLPDGLTSIGNGTFYNCDALTSITLPDGLTSIGDYAFEGCRSLTSITLPEGVTSIGVRAFYNCSALTSITIPEGVTKIGNYAFYNCDALTSITIPEGVTKIGNYAFYSCDALTSITLPEGVTEIGDYAFYSCDALTSITIPEGVTKIGNYAFCYCYALTSITLPEGVTSIGNYAFYSCNNLLVVINKSDLTITAGSWDNGYVAYYATIVTDSESKIKTVGDYIFYADGDTVELIAYTGNETSITLPSDYEGKNYNIGERAFGYCYSLTSITIPEGVTSIGNDAFRNCSSLASITLPDGLTSIGDHAFVGCTGLKNIESASIIPPTLNGYVFDFVDNTISIIVPISSVDDYQNAFGWRDFVSLSIDGITYEYDEQTNSLIVAQSKTSYSGDVVIPEKVIYNGDEYDVTAIGDNAFYLCNDLKHVTIPNTVTSIGEGAFYQCWWLKEIQIPNSVVTIGANAFNYCSGLMFLTLPSSVVSIGDDAFENCYKLREIYNQSDLNIVAGSETYGNIAYYATNVYNEEGANKIKLIIDNYVFYEDADNVVLLGSLTDDFVAVFPDTYCGKNYSIGESAFEGHTFTSITLPDGLTSIGNNAFAFCYALTSIISKNTTPPTVEYGAFNYLYKSIPVYVPKSSVEAYKSAYGWSEFTNIQAIDETASSIIDSTTDSITVRINGNEIVVEGTDNYTVYSIAGQSLGKVVSVEKGIYIVVVNGKSYKVIANK